jgi:hypothetical protein
VSDEEIEELGELEFWIQYDWNWKSPSDVKEFVVVATERETFEYAFGTLGVDAYQEYIDHWWNPVQDAIALMAKNFSREDLSKAINYILYPEGDPYSECDPAIFDALLKFVPGFPNDFPDSTKYLDKVMPENDSSDWWAFSWYPLLGENITWTFWGPETMARSTNINPKYLRRIFERSFVAINSYRSFRARVALATNSNCPEDILEFLWTNRDSENWLLNDYEEFGLLTQIDGKYLVNETVAEFEECRKTARMALDFRIPTDGTFDSGPGAWCVENLLDIQWAADSARTCLLAAFAKNTNLSEAQYEELYKETEPLVRYFLSKNPSLKKELKIALALESPTFTFTPYDGDQEEVTLK